MNKVQDNCDHAFEQTDQESNGWRYIRDWKCWKCDLERKDTALAKRSKIILGLAGICVAVLLSIAVTNFILVIL